MTTFDFIVHCASYSIPSSQCGTVLYTKKYKTSIKKYNILFVSCYSLNIISIFYYRLGPSFTYWLLLWAWAKLYVLTSDMSLGQTLCLNFWCGLFLLWAYFISQFPHLQLPLKFLLFVEERDLTETVEKYISPFKVLNETQSGIVWSAILSENMVWFTVIDFGWEQVIRFYGSKIRLRISKSPNQNVVAIK